VTEQQFQIVRAAGFVVAVGFAMALQRLRPHAGHGSSVRVNVRFWLVNLVVIGALCGACACTVARWAAAGQVGILNAMQVPAWIEILTTLATLDLVSYVWHRANHRIGLLWRFHQVHHSDGHYTVSTAARFHPGEVLLSLPIRLGAVVALGASPLAVVMFEVAFAVANFFEHGDIDLPSGLETRLGRIFVVPALHRRHHSRDPRALNTNFATILIVWDRLFGTYGASSSGDTFDAGLPDGSDHARFGEALTLPARLTPGWRGG